MTTISIKEYSENPEFKYCNFCEYFKLMKDPKFGEGTCSAAYCPSYSYFWAISCNQFKCSIHPVIHASKEDIEKFRNKIKTFVYIPSNKK